MMEEGSLLNEILSSSGDRHDQHALENTLLVDVFWLPCVECKDNKQGRRIVESLLNLARLGTDLNQYLQQQQQQQPYPWIQGGQGPVFGIHFSTTDKIPHLRAQCRYGVSANDAWALVGFVWQWTQRQTQHNVAISCWDADDGQILLIEAAHVLPAWVDEIGPAACRHVCWIQQGRVVLVAPPACYNNDNNNNNNNNTPILTKKQALHALYKKSTACQRFASMDKVIQQRVAASKTPPLNHKAAVALPVPVAHLLQKRPELLPLAVSSWADLIQQRHTVVRVEDEFLSPATPFFTADNNDGNEVSWQWTVQSFPRISFAISRTVTANHNDWATPETIPARYYQQSSASLKRMQRLAQNHATPHLQAAVALGVRLVAGLERLVGKAVDTSSQHQLPSTTVPSRMFASDTEERVLHHWVQVDTALRGANGGDWIREAWQAGPNQAAHSLEHILQCPVYHPEVHNQLYPTKYPLQSARKVIQSTLQSCPTTEPLLRDNVGLEPPSREQVDLDESWLNIGQDDVFLRQAQQEATTEHDTEEMQQVLDGFRTFMSGEGGVEGVAHTNDVEQNETSCSKDGADCGIRPAAFLHLLRETLAAPTVNDLEKYLQQTTERQDLYFSQEDYALMEPDSDDNDDDEEASVDQEMVAVMQQMDEELKGTAPSASRYVDSVDIKDLDNDEVAEDAHVLSNLVESVAASVGGPGPVRNILQEMGKRVPSPSGAQP